MNQQSFSRRYLMLSNKHNHPTRRPGNNAGVATPAQPQPYTKPPMPPAPDRFNATQQSRQEQYERDARLNNSVQFQDHRPDTNPIEFDYPKQEEFRTGHFGAYNQGPNPVPKPGQNKVALPSQDYSQGHDYFLAQHLQGEHSGKGPKGYHRSPDRIREDVCEILFHHGDVDATDIEVHVLEGVVTLEGTVKSRFMKKAAEALLENVAGVEDIHNRLTISKNHN